MNTSQEFPAFDVQFKELNSFILELVEEYRAEKIKSWDHLDERVKSFFTPERMGNMEAAVPGWSRMASYSDGVTLTHVICVFLGLFMLPEFRALTPEQQQLAKWVVLFHDLAKETEKCGRDFTHGFRSAALAARILPNPGFEVSPEYKNLIDPWSEFTSSAVTKPSHSINFIQNNRKLPEILEGIKKLFGDNSPASMIVKGVLLHMSIDAVKGWPQSAPLTEDEINKNIDQNLYPLLRVMNLADSEGWSMFHPEIRKQQREDILHVFSRIEEMISKK